MACTVTLHPKLPLVEMKLDGMVSIVGVGSGLKQVIDLVQGSGRTRVLADCSLLRGGHTLADLYRLVEGMGTIPIPPRLREAVLLPAEGPGVALAEFWETICTNRGIDVRVFSDRGKAMEWLAAGLAA